MPSEVLQEFEEIDDSNQDYFDFMVANVVIKYLEGVCLGKEPCWKKALEFPDNLASAGRLRLHDLAEYFGLASHSAGKKPKRRTLMYPKNLFVEKQELEKVRLEKERDKYREKYDTIEKFPNGPPQNPTNFKEIVMKEIWDEKFAEVKKEPSYKIMAGIGEVPNAENLL